MSNKPTRFRRKLRTDVITLAVDPDDLVSTRPAQMVLFEARQALEAAQQLGDAKATTDAQAKVDEAQKVYDAALVGKETVTLTMRAMSGTQLQVLQSDHPPTDEQVERAAKTGDRLDYNPDTYPPALLVAACVGVEWSTGEKTEALTAAEANDLWETSSAGDQEMLLMLVGLLNHTPNRVEALGKG